MLINAPKESPVRLKLLELAGERVVDADSLRRILWLLNAHPDVVALPTVALNLQEIFSAVEEENWSNEFWESLGPGWEDGLQFVIDERDELQKKIGGRFDVDFEEDHHPLVHDGLHRYSVFATLCNSHRTDSMKRKYRLLQAHLLVAHARSMRQHTTLEGYESYVGEAPLLHNEANPYPAALAVRELSDSKLMLLLKGMPVSLPPERFYLMLPDVVTASIEESKRVDAIRVFCEKVFGERVRGTRKGGSGGNRGSGPIIHGNGNCKFYIEDIHSIETHGGRGGNTVTTRRKLRSNEAQRREMLKADVCPTEDCEEDELDMQSFSEEGFKSSPGSFQQAAAAQSNHLIMANQMFPWAWGKLAVPELRALLVDEPRRIESLLSSEEVLTKDEEDLLETLAFLLVLFWTGCEADAVRGLRIYRSRKVRAFRLGLVVPGKGKLPFWLVRTPFDYAGGRFDKPEPGTDRNRTEFCEIPDIADASRLVRRLWEGQAHARKAGEEKRESSRIFRHDLKWYGRGIQTLIERYGGATRLTMNRISEVMLTRVQQVSRGEMAASAILTGRNLTLAHARLFYACPSVWRMQTIYMDAVREIHRELQPEEDLPLSGAARHLKSLHVCFRPCPTLEAVGDAVRRMQEDLATLSRYDSQSGFIPYHNLYTLYTCMMFAYVTGVRGIATPYLELNGIDTGQGLTLITDKDHGLGYKTRLAWILPELRDQMAYYKQHLTRLPVLCRKPEWPAFYIDAKMRPVEVRPSTSLPHLEPYLYYPINIHRRVVSSAMLETGCPPEVVDAWMGHWYRGEEPWRTFSSFAFADFRMALEEYLQPLILKQLGFRAIAPFEKLGRTA